MMSCVCYRSRMKSKCEKQQQQQQQQKQGSAIKFTFFTVSSRIPGFTLASVTSRKVLTQGIVLTQRFSTLVYICI